MKYLFSIILCFIICYNSYSKNITFFNCGIGNSKSEASLASFRSSINKIVNNFIVLNKSNFNSIDSLSQLLFDLNKQNNIFNYNEIYYYQLDSTNCFVINKYNFNLEGLISYLNNNNFIAEQKGREFTFQIKELLIKEQIEDEFFKDVVNISHQILQKSLDFNISNTNPKAVDVDSKYWSISNKIDIFSNDKIVSNNNFLINSFTYFSLNDTDLAIYKNLNKETFNFELNYKLKKYDFSFRKLTNVKLLDTFLKNWNWYLLNFNLKDSKFNLNFYNANFNVYLSPNSSNLGNCKYNLIDSHNKIASISWSENKTIEELDSFKPLTIKVNNESNNPIFFNTIDKKSSIIDTSNSSIHSPEFPGGNLAFAKYIQTHFRVSDAARESGKNGVRIITKFIVNTDGSISDVKLLNSVGYGLDEEALRVVRNFPKWTPGSKNGIIVESTVTLPLNIDIE
jgi:TonB family protein